MLSHGFSCVFSTFVFNVSLLASDAYVVLYGQDGWCISHLGTSSAAAAMPGDLRTGAPKRKTSRGGAQTGVKDYRREPA